MEMETMGLLLTIFHALVSVFIGILVLVIFVMALKRKGRSALLLLPLGLMLTLWWSWVGPRQNWIFYSTGGNWAYFIWVVAERLFYSICWVLPFLLIFKKDKPKMDELSDGLKTEEPSYGS